MASMLIIYTCIANRIIQSVHDHFFNMLEFAGHEGRTCGFLGG